MSASQQVTQYDQPATQLVDDMPLDDEEEEQTESASWGQLVSRSPDGPHFKLQEFPPDEQGRFNVHLIGRSPHCALQLTSSPRISNKHCILYCKQNIADPNNPRLEAWIEDLSANGTFINGETRLTKNVPRLLHHRDEIFLVNPEFKRMAKAGTKIFEDIAQNSFVVMLNLPCPVDEFIQASRDYDLQLSQNDASQGGRMDRANTVNRLLGQKRCVYDHYEIKTLLGEGTSGAVYHGINKETGRDWAVKIVPTKNLTLLSSVINNKGRSAELNGNELTKEAELLRSLRHPHIIHLEDIFADNKRLYLVMELSSGGDLFDRVVKKKHYPEAEAKIVMTQILEAMAYLHEKNIAHRDIKPENILLVSKSSDVDIKLTDFGLAKKVDESGKMKTFCGTPQYFAPEVLQRRHTTKGAGTYSLAADMWSIGVIMFVLLEGNYPFNESTLSQQITTAQYSFAAPVWKKVSEQAKDLIRKLLVVDPAARLTAKQALAHEWFSASTEATDAASHSVSFSAAEQNGTASNGHGKQGKDDKADAKLGIAFADSAGGHDSEEDAMVVDGDGDGEPTGKTGGANGAVRSETVSTNVTEPTVVGALQAASGSIDEADGQEADAGNTTHNGAGKSGKGAKSRKAAAQADEPEQVPQEPSTDEFQGRANMSITTQVRNELEKVHLNGAGDQEASPAKATATRKRKLPPTVGAASAVPAKSAKKHSSGSETSEAVAATPTKRGRAAKATPTDSAAQKKSKGQHTMDGFVTKQSPAVAKKSKASAAAASPAQTDGASMAGRRVTRSASTYDS
jgi:serine/threonine protein kinase